ncbi:MAG: type VI secretion system baseplate subunit TssG [Gammaproteobacteria bacterium]
MAGEPGQARDPVKLFEALAREPNAFGFFSTLRRLECAHAERPRLGTSVRPADDPIRLGQEPSLAFAPSTLAGFAHGEHGRPPRLTSYFFGLFGPNGALPLHLTEYASERQRHAHDPTFARFLDVFHHRMLTLFYRAWANGQPAVNLDRPQSDRFGVYVGALFGIGMPSLRDRDEIEDHAKLFYAGRFACQTRHPEGLRAILQDFFRLPVCVREFIGHWMALPHEARWRLGSRQSPGALGASALLGARVWDCQTKFRIVLGPMGLVDYRHMLPGGNSLKRLVALVRNYMGFELAWDVNLMLKRNEVPTWRLGDENPLGWSTWLVPRPAGTDADDLVLNPC